MYLSHGAKLCLTLVYVDDDDDDDNIHVSLTLIILILEVITGKCVQYTSIHKIPS